MRFFRIFFTTFFLLLFLILCVALYFAFESYHHKNPETQTLIFQKGTSVRKMASLLKKKNIITNRHLFEIYLRLTQQTQKIHAGEYEFLKNQRFFDVTDILVSGKTKKYQITIPEGYTLKEVCRAFSQKKISDENTCLEIMNRIELRLPDPAQTPEGYLFPETYTYDALMTPEQIIQNMAALFFKKLGPHREAQARQKGFSLHELVTFASVVEKETGLASERPKIAGVFYNRFKQNMPWQSDPTVIYGIKDFDGNLTKSHLLTDTAYNTYTRTGLPAGPICNPGLASLEAVLNPEATEAVYFVAKQDGGHYFSKTIEQHNRAVQYYQLKQGLEPEYPSL